MTFSVPPTRLIHVDLDPHEPGRNYPTTIAATADAALALDAIAEAYGTATADRGYDLDCHPSGARRLPGSQPRECGVGRPAVAAGAHPGRRSPRGPRRDPRHRCRLEQERGRPAVPDRYAPTRSTRPAASRRWASARPRSLALPRPRPGDRRSPSSAMAHSAPTRMSWPRPSRWGSPPIWVVMNNAAFGTIAGLQRKHYGTGFGCEFEADGASVLARTSRRSPEPVAQTGSRSRMPASWSRRSAWRCTSGRPTVIDVPMRNTPVMTPGEWDIERIYQVGTMKVHDGDQAHGARGRVRTVVDGDLRHHGRPRLRSRRRPRRGDRPRTRSRRCSSACGAATPRARPRPTCSVACMVASIDHGPLSPSALVARTIASTRAIVDECARRRHPVLRRPAWGRRDPRDAAHQSRRRRTATWMPGPTRRSPRNATPAGGCQASGIAGIEHRPRAERLLEVASTHASDGTLLARASPRCPRRATCRPAGRRQHRRGPGRRPDGASPGPRVRRLPVRRSRSSFGLAAHIVEERTRERPMRLIDPTAALYDGLPIPTPTSQETDR